jgi:hypothetical protein
MESKTIIKAVLVLIILGVLIYMKVSYTEMSNGMVLTLDGLIVILLLSMGQKAISASVLVPAQLYDKVKKFFKSQQAR